MGSFLGALISGVASVVGGLFGQSSQQSINSQNIAQQNFLASNRIQMTVADAKKAGINPLAALGNATQTYSNVVGSNDLGAGIGRAGQDIGRAIQAMTEQPTRAQELENKLLEAKIANVNADTVHSMAVTSGMSRGLGAPGTPPSIPLPRPNPLTVNWDAYNAKPLMETYVGPHGGLVELPTGSASTAMQNWASMPAQIAVASGIAGENLGRGVQDIDPGWGMIPGAVWRATSSDQYSPYLSSSGAY